MRKTDEQWCKYAQLRMTIDNAWVSHFFFASDDARFYLVIGVEITNFDICFSFVDIVLAS